jgi:hypothetical protein
MNIFQLRSNVRVRATVNIDLSADQWELNTEGFPRTTMNQVATYLNKRFNFGYNKGMSKEELATYVQHLMGDFTVYGANEDKPKQVLESLIETVYP